MDNKFNVEMVNNMLFSLGAKIYENSKEDLLHASGHACQEDLKLMLKIVNPEYFMPFHGDFRMLKKHGCLGKELGVDEKKIFICKNGEVLEHDGERFALNGEKIDTTPSFVLNRQVLSLEELNRIELSREEMSRGGCFLVIFFYDKEKKKIQENPYIFTYGFINMKQNEKTVGS
jgi:ribonuclease J